MITRGHSPLSSIVIGVGNQCCFLLIGAMRFEIQVWAGLSLEVTRHDWRGSAFEPGISRTLFDCSFKILAGDSHTQQMWTWDYSVVRQVGHGAHDTNYNIQTQLDCCLQKNSTESQ